MLGWDGAAWGVGEAGAEGAGSVPGGAEPRAGDSRSWSKGSSTARTREAGQEETQEYQPLPFPMQCQAPLTLAHKGSRHHCSSHE